MCDKQLLRGSSIKQPGKPSVKRRNRHVLINLPESDPNRSYQLRTKVLIASLAALVFVSALSGYLIGSADYAAARRALEPPDPIEPLKPSASRLHVFRKAAVCTDAPQCSEIGKKVLLSNGSAVDAAVAAMFCNGLLNQQSMGLGGGFFMTVYIKEEEKAYTVIARETAPAAAAFDMFNGSYDKATKGPLSVGVPGELRGMWAAHQRWGKLPWSDLVQPTIAICTKGFQMSIPMHDGLLSAPFVKNDANLKKQYVDSTTSNFYKPGTIIKPSPALCKTLSTIAEKGGDVLYNGSLSIDFLEDLHRIGSIITADDLRNYQAKITEPIAVSLGNGDILYTPPPPSSGVILVNILNILSGYHFNASSINSTEDQILTYHRILEAFKFSYATRTKLGDADFLDLKEDIPTDYHFNASSKHEVKDKTPTPNIFKVDRYSYATRKEQGDADFLDLKELIANVTSPEYGNEIRLRINDTMTSNSTATYGATQYNQPDHGTAHISIIATNGDAVSMTSSVNFYYGAGFSTLNTGIIMNNVMDDFSSPGITNYFGLKPSPANFIAPGKRPLSSMNPSIIVDRNGNAKLVIGASGGTKITTAVALVTMRKLWFDQSIKEAVDEARIHHQIFPMNGEYEFGITDDVIKGLKEKGHGMVRYRGRGSIICALYRNSTAIFANADFRKGGDVSGMD